MTIKIYFLVIVGGMLVLCNILRLDRGILNCNKSGLAGCFSVFSILFSSTRAQPVLVKSMIL